MREIKQMIKLMIEQTRVVSSRAVCRKSKMIVCICNCGESKEMEIVRIEANDKREAADFFFNRSNCESR